MYFILLLVSSFPDSSCSCSFTLMFELTAISPRFYGLAFTGRDLYRSTWLNSGPCTSLLRMFSLFFFFFSPAACNLLLPLESTPFPPSWDKVSVLCLLQSHRARPGGGSHLPLLLCSQLPQESRYASSFSSLSGARQKEPFRECLERPDTRGMLYCSPSLLGKKPPFCVFSQSYFRELPSPFPLFLLVQGMQTMSIPSALSVRQDRNQSFGAQ